MRTVFEQLSINARLQEHGEMRWLSGSLSVMKFLIA